MISSPGDVIASAACMNAILAPAVTMIRLPRPTSMWFSTASFRLIAATSGGMPAPSLYSCVAWCASESRTASSVSGGGP